MELSLFDYFRQAGAIDEYQLAENLNLSLVELHQIIAPPIVERYVTVLTKDGRDCLQCSSRYACPGSRIHSIGPETTFSAYRFTSSGMRYRRQVLAKHEAQHE